MKRFLFIWIGIFLFFNVGMAQQENAIHGKVIDKKTRNTVPGVYVFYQNVFLTYSDRNGIFEVPEKYYNADTSVVLKHIGYYDAELKFKKKYKKDFDTIIVYLKRRTYNIGKVTVYGNPLKSILKKASRYYLNTYLPTCYWGACNYRHLVQYNKESIDYLEIDGYVFLRRPNKYGFGSEFNLIPEEFRRIRGNESKIEFLNSLYSNDVAIEEINSAMLGFSFLETIHPLNKWFSNKYTFSYDSLKDADCYVINFKQKKDFIVVPGWKVRDMRGQMRIDRTTYEIKEISCSFQIGAQINQMCVFYHQKDHIIYPKKITISQVYENIENSNVANEIYSYSVLKVNGDLTIAQECYRDANYYLLSLALDQKSYHPEYWSKRDIDDRFMESGVKELMNNGFIWSQLSQDTFKNKIPEIMKERTKNIIEFLNRDMKK